MKGNDKVIDYLNRALRLELSAINQFWIHEHQRAAGGLSATAGECRAARREAVQSADHLLARLTFLEGTPNVHSVDTIETGETVRSCFECEFSSARRAQLLFQEAAQYCRSVGDIPTANLFEDLMATKEGRIGGIERELRLMTQTGDENYALLVARQDP
ncbi:MAG: ferritin-like domain-containing protein [Pseudomonadota bacterium]